MIVAPSAPARSWTSSSGQRRRPADPLADAEVAAQGAACGRTGWPETRASDPGVLDAGAGDLLEVARVRERSRTPRAPRAGRPAPRGRRGRHRAAGTIEPCAGALTPSASGVPSTSVSMTRASMMPSAIAWCIRTARAAAAEVVDEVHGHSGRARSSGGGDEVADELAQRASSWGAGSATWWTCRPMSKFGSSSQRGPRAGSAFGSSETAGSGRRGAPAAGRGPRSGSSGSPRTTSPR